MGADKIGIEPTRQNSLAVKLDTEDDKFPAFLEKPEDQHKGVDAEGRLQFGTLLEEGQQRVL